MVLEALSQQTFEPLGDISLKLRSSLLFSLYLLLLVLQDLISGGFWLSRQFCSCRWCQPNLSVVCMYSLIIPCARNSLSVEMRSFSSLTWPLCQTAHQLALVRCLRFQLFTLLHSFLQCIRLNTLSCSCPMGLHQQDQPFQEEWLFLMPPKHGESHF